MEKEFRTMSKSLGKIIDQNKFSKFLSKRREEAEAEVVNRARVILANFWDNFTNIYHGHQVFGLENIPSNSPVLLVWYHGPVPIDYFSLVAKLYIRDGKLVNSVVHKSLKRNPFWKVSEKLLKVTSNGRSYCVDQLENGETVGVAVGGAEEACFDFDYNTEWGSRTGFAHVALLAGVPIIPIFTENIREAYTTMRTGETIWRFIYETIKVPVIPLYGGLPVKLITHVGTPILLNEKETAEQLAKRVQTSMQGMISKHQNKEKSVFGIIMDRFYQ